MIQASSIDLHQPPHLWICMQLWICTSFIWVVFSFLGSQWSNLLKGVPLISSERVCSAVSYQRCHHFIYLCTVVSFAVISVWLISIHEQTGAHFYSHVPFFQLPQTLNIEFSLVVCLQVCALNFHWMLKVIGFMNVISIRCLILAGFVKLFPIGYFMQSNL